MKIYYRNTFDFPWPLEDESVDVIITSPPYFRKVQYRIPDVQIDRKFGRYGLEETVEEYVAHTVLWVKEDFRVLKKDGLFFLNLGDSFRNLKKLIVPHRVLIRIKVEFIRGE